MIEGESGVTGSLEHYNIVPTVMILKRIRPNIKEILLISEPSITGQAILRDFKAQLSDPSVLSNANIEKLTEFVDVNFENLKRRLLAVNPDKVGVVFIAYYTYRDSSGRPVSYHDIDQWVSDNTSFLDVGTADFNVKNGRLLSLASSGEELGFYVANQLFKALQEEKDPNVFPIRRYIPLQLTFNQEKLVRLKIDLPYEIVSYAQALSELNQ